VLGAVDSYFRLQRPQILASGGSQGLLKTVDTGMQTLLRCSQHNTLLSVYKTVLKKLHDALDEVELRLIASRALPEDGDALEAPDAKIETTLKGISATAAASYRQACLDLRDEERASWRGTAVELREALRETLDKLAPDQSVMAQKGYQPERQNSQLPSTKQKVRYILSQRDLTASAKEATERAGETIDTAVGNFVRSVQNAASAGTHTPMRRQDVKRIKEYVDLTLRDLLEIP
jgi:hypothetical protein